MCFFRWVCDFKCYQRTIKRFVTLPGRESLIRRVIWVLKRFQDLTTTTCNYITIARVSGNRKNWSTLRCKRRGTFSDRGSWTIWWSQPSRNSELYTRWKRKLKVHFTILLNRQINSDNRAKFLAPRHSQRRHCPALKQHQLRRAKFRTSQAYQHATEREQKRTSFLFFSLLFTCSRFSAVKILNFEYWFSVQFA